MIRICNIFRFGKKDLSIEACEGGYRIERWPFQTHYRLFHGDVEVRRGEDIQELRRFVEVMTAPPDQIEIYRAIKRSGARKHSEIARVIAELYTLHPLQPEGSEND